MTNQPTSGVFRWSVRIACSEALSGWLLREGLPRALLAGIAVSIAGVILTGIAASAGRHSSLSGVLLCLLAAASYATAVISQKPALAHASPLQVTTLSCAVGTAACLPFSGQLTQQLAAAPLTATLSAVYLGVFPTAVAFTTWAYALSRTPAGKLGATTYLVPALTVLMSWAILSEVPRWPALAGGALCLAGVALSRRARNATARPRGAARDAWPSPSEGPVSALVPGHDDREVLVSQLVRPATSLARRRQKALLAAARASRRPWSCCPAPR